jgi:RING finger and CHY zinc finger domain-containing protein 1
MGDKQCEHYDKHCKIYTSCCSKYFNCRLCHDKISEDCPPLDRFKLDRIMCKKCDTEQPISNTCIKCNIKFGSYFCKICNLFDNNTDKQQFHCPKCGICRVGGMDNFYHCGKCGICISIKIKDTHKCINNSFHSNCPICFDPLFDSTKPLQLMKCGHTIHSECFTELLSNNTLSSIRCPICNKTTIDATNFFNYLENEINSTPLPDELKYDVRILCNDCNLASITKFHIIGHKCIKCGSFNTVKND